MLRKLRQRVMRRVRSLVALSRGAVVYGSDKRRASDRPPVFIVGCPRSGTTLLRQILDCHSRLALPGETWFLIGMFEQLRSPFFVKGLRGLGVERPEAVANIREFALNYFEKYLYREGKARWGDKTPGYVDYAPEILEVFGDVRFVFMLRHGLDVVNSMQDRHWIGLIEPDKGADRLSRLQASARLWIRHNENFHAFMAKHPSICHTVRYEDLTGRPEATVKGVLEFLGEPWEPRILEYQAFPHSGVGDSETPTFEKIRTNSGNYRAWPPEEQQMIREILAAHLERYGYAEDLALAR